MKTNKRDYYEILGVPRNADQAAIKKAYRKLAKKYHPDSNDGSAEAELRFKEITEAYTILQDPEKRKLYDQFGHAAFDGSSGAGQDAGGFGGGAYGPSGYTYYYQSGGQDGNPFGRNSGGQSFEDILKHFFHRNNFSGDNYTGDNFSRDGFSGDSFSGNDFSGKDDTGRGSWKHFGYNGDGNTSYRQHFGYDDGRNTSYRQHFGYGDRSGSKDEGFDWFDFGGSRQEPLRGRDMEADTSISFEEAAFGCKKRIRLTSPESGKSQTLEVKIPAGIEDGQTIRLKGKGQPGMADGEAGDLLLKIHVMEKAGFTRKGADIYTTAQIPFTTAVLGGEAILPTLYGNVQCHIQKGTQSGSRLRLKGKGIVSSKAPGIRGDEYVTIEIQVPTQISGEAERCLKAFEQSLKGRKPASGAA